MSKYYDWNKALAYDADVTMVVGARGIGKTYGLRLQCIRDYIKHGYKFCELVRFKNELSGVANGYFNRIEKNKEFPEYVFKTDSSLAYIAVKPEGEEKPKWEVFGYFLALSQAQMLKKRTYDNVKRFIFDEAVMDKTDKFHHYLSGEFSKLANIVDTVSRERADTKGIAPRVYLLGNALDIMNPYFIHYNVGVPKLGYTWHDNKNMLLHYVENNEYSKHKAEETVAGRMLAGTEAGDIANQNTFSKMNKDFVMKKTKASKFDYGIKYNGFTYGVWTDWDNGYIFITSKIPNNTTQPIFTLTMDENRVNYIAARRAETRLRSFADMHYMGIIRYESVAVRERFKEILTMFGVR